MVETTNTEKKALVTGIYGQDAAYLAEYLISKGYMVYGAKRRSASSSPWRLEQLGLLTNERLQILECDITDPCSLHTTIKETRPHEIYNTAAMSHVGTSFSQPIVSANVNALGVLNILEAIRQIDANIKFMQCSTSELYGNLSYSEQSKTLFHPRSPYGVAKLFGYWTAVNYREAYNIFAANAISYNHESSLRGEEFVTRKITKGIADIVVGKKAFISLGNIDAKRDWGHAKDFVKGFHKILNHHTPGDFVLATGESHSVREFLDIAFRVAGLGNYEKYIVIDPKFFRPAEVPDLKGDASYTKEVLGWEPEISFEELVKEMVVNDLQQVDIKG